MKVEVKGAKQVMAALKKMDPELNKEITASLLKSAGQVRNVARSYVDPVGLSGWKQWRGGYSPQAISSGIKTKRGGRRKRGHVTVNFIGITNANAAGAIWEVAGRRSSGKAPGKGQRGNGAGMVTAMNSRGGPASRTIWAAVDSGEGERAKQEVGAALNRAAAAVQSMINQG